MTTTDEHALVDYADEIIPDLASISPTFVGNEAEATLAQQQAAATMVMRRMRAIQHGLDTQDEAMRLELQAIRDMYETSTKHERDRLAAYRRYVETIAELMEWGKKKSHDSPYGTFGVRSAAASVNCVDRIATSAWAAEHSPELVQVEITIPLNDARERFSTAELEAMGELDVKWKELKATLDPAGELPPGVESVPAARTPYAKIS